MTTATDSSGRAEVCDRTRRICRVCWYGPMCGPFYGIERVSIDEERPCPCSCHRDRGAAEPNAISPDVSAVMETGSRYGLVCHSSGRIGMNETTARCAVCGEDPHWHDIKKHDAAVADATVARDAVVTALTAERDHWAKRHDELQYRIEDLVNERDGARRDVRALAEALRSCTKAGLVLQQAVGRLSGPLLEELGLMLEWEIACLKHGQAMEVLNAVEGPRGSAREPTTTPAGEP